MVTQNILRTYLSVDANPVDGLTFRWTFNNTSETAVIKVNTNIKLKKKQSQCV